MASGTPPKKPFYKKWWGIALIVLGVLFVLGAIFGGGGDTTATDEPQAEVTAEATEPATEETEPAAEESEEPVAEEEPAAGIGDPVRDGKFEFTVTDVESGQDKVGENEFLTQEAQGEFTLVTMKIENIGDEPQTFFSDNVTGTDAKGREVASDSTATLYANEGNDAWISEINPGNSIEAIVVFDTAKGVKLVAVEVKDSAFSGGATISLE